MCDHFPTSTFLGYIDKVKEGEDIHKLKDIADTSFDFILILSQNHFDKIYDDHKHHISLNKLYKIDIKDNRYHFLARNEILRYKFQVIPQQISMLLLKFLTRLNYILNLSGRKVVFVAKGFVGANTKMLFLYHATVDNQTILLTDNVQQLKSLKNVGLKVFPLF
ncbi:hypothetical protein [sulfur-oxidizing endosymbiont of Gigantopelta aegis]|uniref:hypothetical protein n=1 Tax=sulfur-oxidizing endosymbiont of Gigantopelta aegis TaxID=2794934 RepID=UPI0018DD7DD4|nr:hypothetical protein [sulfur-oxidizing endosymbiont of Gigantopelta aegis]